MKTISKLAFLSLIVGAQLCRSSLAVGADILLLTHPSLKLEAIDNGKLQKIYVGDTTQWPSGGRIRVAQLADDSKLTKNFLADNLSMTLADYNQHWRYLLFSGRAIPPKKFDTEEALIQFVHDTPGAIGYVHSKTDISKWKVKVLNISNK